MDSSNNFLYFFQQIQRYNFLLNTIRKSLTDLELGIQGMVVMTLDLENIFQCIYDGHVPPTWEKVTCIGLDKQKISA